MKKAIVISVGILLAGCFTAKMLTPTQADVERVQHKYPGYTLADLNHGKALYEKNCATCHKLKHPESQTEEGWKHIVPIMVKKVNKNNTVLDTQDEESILRYVLTMREAK